MAFNCRRCDDLRTHRSRPSPQTALWRSIAVAAITFGRIDHDHRPKLPFSHVLWRSGKPHGRSHEGHRRKLPSIAIKAIAANCPSLKELSNCVTVTDDAIKAIAANCLSRTPKELSTSTDAKISMRIHQGHRRELPVIDLSHVSISKSKWAGSWLSLRSAPLSRGSTSGFAPPRKGEES